MPNARRQRWWVPAVMAALVLASRCTPTMAVGDTAVVQSLQKWRHHCVQTGSVPEASEAANGLGSKGWELVSVASVSSGLVLCFKRPVPTE